MKNVLVRDVTAWHAIRQALEKEGFFLTGRPSKTDATAKRID